MSFVEVPAAAIRERLVAAGFTLLPGTRGEEIYSRQHAHDQSYLVRVYSSIQHGDDGVRGRGEDAIRVVALHVDSKFRWPAKTIPIFKAKRVFRTGSVEAVLARMIERAREAYAACNKHRNGGKREREARADGTDRHQGARVVADQARQGR